MVLPVSKFITSTSGDSGPQRPLLNSMPYTGTISASKVAAFNTQYRTFMRRFKQSPELYGIINILVTDIIGDRPKFVSPDGLPLGRNKRLQAEKFWKKNRIKETLKAILFDEFVTGDGYGWKGKISIEDKEAFVKKVLAQYKEYLGSEEYSKLYIKTMMDEDLKLTKKFDYIPSSTVNIESNLYDITGYVQVSNGVTKFFKPEEVIHFRLNTIDGNVQGYSPVEALMRELALLYFVKGNMLAYLENGGRPDLLFTLKNAQPNSDMFNNFAQQLRAFKQLENSHGGLLGTGEVMVTDLSFGKQKDMEYQNLALWLMSGMLFAFGIPVSRVPFLIGKAATGGDSGGMAESGYQSMISEKQDEIEDLLNYQMFEEMGWHIRLPRHYKQDEVREAQTFSMNADTVTKLQSIYMKQGKKLTTDKINMLLNVCDDDLEEMSPDEQMMNNPMNAMSMRNQNMLDNNSVMKEPDNRKRADTKRNVANANVNKGLNV
jgi:hypothetical protein